MFAFQANEIAIEKQRVDQLERAIAVLIFAFFEAFFKAFQKNRTITR